MSGRARVLLENGSVYDGEAELAHGVVTFTGRRVVGIHGDLHESVVTRSVVTRSVPTRHVHQIRTARLATPRLTPAAVCA